jgi:hypothetical protein
MADPAASHGCHLAGTIHTAVKSILLRRRRRALYNCPFAKELPGKLAGAGKLVRSQECGIRRIFTAQVRT